LMNDIACEDLPPASTLMALNAGPRWLDLIPSSTSSMVRDITDMKAAIFLGLGLKGFVQSLPFRVVAAFPCSCFLVDNGGCCRGESRFADVGSGADSF